MSQRSEEDDRRRWLYLRDPGLYGTARWATREHLIKRGYGGGNGFVFGYAPPADAGQAPFPITYRGARHLVTCAPNRAGKGVSTCIPALLSHRGPAICVDPRGEIAAATAAFRVNVLGQRVAVYDPYEKITPYLECVAQRFNPLDILDAQSATFFDDAMVIGDALIMGETHSTRFWPDEAMAACAGIGSNVAADPREAGQKTLGRLREILSLPLDEFRDYVGGKFVKDPGTGKFHLVRPGMLQSSNEYVRRAAGRILSKPERQLGDILSTAQQNTHFLEGRVIQDSLAASDFSFADLERGDLTVYLVLPPERLRTHGRLLRLLIAAAIDAINKMAEKPNPSCLFMLDEMGPIGKLDTLLDAFGVLAGSGMQIHAIFQDFSQARGIYGDRWQTFIANSAVVQAFGTRDVFTAEYVSKLCGTATVEQVTYESAARRYNLLGDPTYFSRDDLVGSRPLITPDELMTLHPAVQILVLANAHPVNCFRAPYFLDARFRDRRGSPLFEMPPQYRDRALPPPVDFTRAGSNLFAALASYLNVG